MSLCVAKIRLNPHKHSIPSTSKRMKVTSVDDEVDDTDIDATEVFTDVQVAKQVRSSMKKWIKVKMMFLAQLREDEHYSMCVKPNERSSGLFSVSIRCMACGKAIMLQQKMRQPIYVVSNWYIDMRAKLCFTKTRSAERLTQLAIHKCLPRSSHRNAMNALLWTSIGVHFSLSQDTKCCLLPFSKLKTN